MSECYRDYFIKNDHILKCENFRDSDVLEGTSLYEVIRIIDGIPLFLEKHLERLKYSSNIVKLRLWMEINEIKNKISEVIKVNNIFDGNVKIVFNFNKNDESEKNTFLAYFIPHHYPSEKQYSEGVKTILFFAERNNPNAKVVNDNLRRRTDEKMKETGSYEALLVDKSGNITEGSRSNIFMVKGDVVISAPLGDVLPGITRQSIIDICSQEGLNFREERVSYKDLKAIDALFITGTSPKVLPIKSVDDKFFSSSTNIIVQNILRAYNNNIDIYIKQNKII
jgi:branched-chain amino acid aminotransferase